MLISQNEKYRANSESVSSLGVRLLAAGTGYDRAPGVNG